MKREETLFQPSYEFMKKRGYKITKNSSFNEFKSPILIFRAYKDRTDVESIINEGYEPDYFVFSEKDVIEHEEEEKREIKGWIKYLENASKEELEEYDKEVIEEAMSFKKHLGL